MRYYSLTDAMLGILQAEGTNLSVSEITKQIEEQELWVRPSDGQFPTESQVRRRASHPPFSVTKGTISLIAEIADRQARLCRVTHNTEQWHKPSAHNWKTINQGNSAVAFENQYGFGGEEWLFNPVFLFEGYQYGVIRGLEDLPQNTSFVPMVYLYSIDQISKKRYFIGCIENVEIFRSGSVEENIARNLWKDYENQMISEILDVGGDPKGLKFISPTIRFLPENVTFLNPIAEVKEFQNRSFNRFTPKKVDDSLSKLLVELLPNEKLIITSGKANTSNTYNKTTKNSETTVTRLHSEITDALYVYINKVGPDFRTLSIELTRFGSNIADCVLEYNDNSISIFEAKTSGNLRRNIREAIGQLVDYAFWYNSHSIKSLIIVSPVKLAGKSLSSFRRMQSSISIVLEYWQYQQNDTVENTFIITR